MSMFSQAWHNNLSIDSQIELEFTVWINFLSYIPDLLEITIICDEIFIQMRYNKQVKKSLFIKFQDNILIIKRIVNPDQKNQLLEIYGLEKKYN